MYFLKQAFLQILMLLIASVISILVLPSLFGVPSSYLGHDVEVPVIVAMGVYEKGKVFTKEDLISEVEIIEDMEISFSLSFLPELIQDKIVDLMNLKVGSKIAAALEYFPFLSVIWALLCFLFNICAPIRFWKNAIRGSEKQMVNKDITYKTTWSDGTISYSHPGETAHFIVCMLWFGILIFLLGLCAVCMPLIILFNVVMTPVMIILKLMFLLLDYNFYRLGIFIKKLRNSGRDVYAIFPGGGHYAIKNLNKPSEVFYIRNYWNARLLEKILEFDSAEIEADSENMRGKFWLGTNGRMLRFEFYKNWAGLGTEQKIQSLWKSGIKIMSGTIEKSFYFQDAETNKITVNQKTNIELIHKLLTSDMRGEVYQYPNYHNWRIHYKEDDTTETARVYTLKLKSN
ncbi:MAG: hypothetical protein K2H29_01930 [Oscillospiraceae bacterium]|nr:hypothetical protein [Oscillospiraceae bacterium]